MGPPLWLLLLGLAHGLNAWVITQDDVADQPRVWDVECGHYNGFKEGCHTRSCKRILEDDFVSREKARQIIAVAKRGIALRPPTAGPTIMVVLPRIVPPCHPCIVVTLVRAAGYQYWLHSGHERPGQHVPRP